MAHVGPEFAAARAELDHFITTRGTTRVERRGKQILQQGLLPETGLRVVRLDAGVLSRTTAQPLSRDRLFSTTMDEVLRRRGELAGDEVLVRGDGRYYADLSVETPVATFTEVSGAELREFIGDHREIYPLALVALGEERAERRRRLGDYTPHDLRGRVELALRDLEQQRAVFSSDVAIGDRAQVLPGAVAVILAELAAQGQVSVTIPRDNADRTIHLT
jgi:hypothetical protein